MGFLEKVVHPIAQGVPAERTNQLRSLLRVPRGRSVGMLLILLGLAYGGNCANLTLFFGVEFLFGSIAVLTVAYFYGQAWGILAGLLAALRTMLAWGHPFGLAIFGAEAAFVGWKLRIRQPQQSLVVRDGLYWLCLGIPLVLLCYGVGLGAALPEALTIALKQAINGLFNALIASLLIAYTPLSRWICRTHYDLAFSLRQQLLSLFVAFVCFPALTLIVLDGQTNLARLENSIVSTLNAMVLDATAEVETWNQRNRVLLEGLQQVLTTMPPLPRDAAQKQLNAVQQTLPIGSVLTIRNRMTPFPAGKSAEVLLNEQLQLVYRLPLEPLNEDGRELVATMSLENLNRVLRLQHFPLPMEVTLLDSEGRVLHTTRTDLKPRSGFDHNKTPASRQITDSVYQWLPATSEPRIKRQRQSRFIQIQALGEIPVSLVVEAYAGPYIDALQSMTLKAMAVTLALVILAIAIASWVSQRLVRPILTLADVTTDLPNKLLYQGSVHLPQTSVTELQSLVANFKTMATTLEQQFQTITQANETLEQRILERTQELQNALKNLQATQTQLIHHEKMSSLGQLVTGVAHEINNPVNFIHGNLAHVREYTQDVMQLLSLYQQYFPDPPTAIAEEITALDFEFIQSDLPRSIQSMQVGTERIREIVRSLRNFSRADEPTMKAVDIHEGIDSSLMILQNRIKGSPQRPTIQVIREYGDLPLVECNPGPLNQVFMNLLVNAIDAIEEQLKNTEDPIEPPCIHITTEQLDRHFVRIQVSDNGPGMPEPVRQQIFEPFFTTKPVGKGTGLGLSISHQIITEKHAGRLECDSAPGKGTTFSIWLPIHYGDQIALAG